MFAENLKAFRLNKGIQQKQLALVMGLSPSSVSMYEQGLRHPDMHTLAKLSQYFGVTVDCLLGLKEDNWLAEWTLLVKEADSKGMKPAHFRAFINLFSSLAQ